MDYHGNLSKRYFICDSLGGINPSKSLPVELIDFLDIVSHTGNLKMTSQLQSIDSELRGKYCVLFIKQMSINHSFCQFLLLFTTNKNKNDSLVSFFLLKFHNKIHLYKL